MGIRSLAVGHVSHDRYGDRLLPGGSAYYAAKTWQALGAEVGLATAVGKDFQCEADLSDFTVQRCLGSHTTSFTNTYPVDGPRVQWIAASAPSVLPACLRPEWHQADVLFLGPIFGELDLSAWLSEVDAGIIGLGLQGLLKQAGTPHPENPAQRAVIRRPWQCLPALLSRLTVVFLSEEDIQVFGDEHLLPSLRQIVPMVVLTRGAQGSTIFCPDQVHEIPIVPTPLIDPTGAGDTFAAAFLHSLALGLSPSQSAHRAAAAASVVVAAEGSSADWSQIEKL